MKLIQSILFLVFFHTVGLSQSFQPIKVLDSVSSSKDILPILISVDSDFRYGVIIDPIIADTVYQKIYGANKANSWAKYDIDGNGMTDLVAQVTNSFTHYSAIVVLLDSGLGNFSLKYITYMAYTQYFKVISNKYLLLVSEHVDYSKHKDSFFIQTDTLIYLNGGFMEYSSCYEKHDFTRINYGTDGGGLGSSPILDIDIDSFGIMKYHGYKMGKYATYMRKLTVQELKAFRNLMDHICISHLKNNYYLPITDLPTATITFTYGTNKKVVEDYGMSGTFALRRLRELFDEYMESDDWKETKE